MLTLENVVSAPIGDTDAGLILKLDGRFQVFTAHKLDGDTMSDAEFSQVRKLQVLSLVLSSPDLMDQLFDVLDELSEAGVDLIDIGQVN